MSESNEREIERIINSICDEFDANWSENNEPEIEQCLGQVEECHNSKLLRLLIEIDLEKRQERDQNISCKIYQHLGSDAVELANELLAKRDQIDATFDAQTRQTASYRESAKLIGPYKLLQRIGTGGMGDVWMAEQEKPVRRRVALKLIRSDFGSRETIARFEAERQALAMMDHQNIAKVLDAGTTDEGTPYFVMELVKGIPFTEYCDKNKLGIPQRLELFIQVCNAVQHAHQKGIIHRDLKPSNILVTLYDGKPVPKVIDFGLAKALEHTTKLTDKTMFTEFGKVVGTLQYMSPEQAEMNTMDVDTRSDIYSLGVMLYELLTGSTPLDKQTLGQNALLQVLAIIRERDPPRPSNRLSSSGDSVTGISDQRKITSNRLHQILRGELDWVVMKALEKDRTRRYETASGFAFDVQSYLDDEPVSARPASTAYKTKKLIKKNWKLASTIGSIVIALTIGFVATTWSARQAEKARGDAVIEGQRASAAKRQLEKRNSELLTVNRKLINISNDLQLAATHVERLSLDTLKNAGRGQFEGEMANSRRMQEARLGVVTSEFERLQVLEQRLDDCYEFERIIEDQYKEGAVNRNDVLELQYERQEAELEFLELMGSLTAPTSARNRSASVEFDLELRILSFEDDSQKEPVDPRIRIPQILIEMQTNVSERRKILREFSIAGFQFDFLKEIQCSEQMLMLDLRLADTAEKKKAAHNRHLSVLRDVFIAPDFDGQFSEDESFLVERKLDAANIVAMILEMEESNDKNLDSRIQILKSQCLESIRTRMNEFVEKPWGFSPEAANNQTKIAQDMYQVVFAICDSPNDRITISTTYVAYLRKIEGSAQDTFNVGGESAIHDVFSAQANRIAAEVRLFEAKSTLFDIQVDKSLETDFRDSEQVPELP